jgi:hypothetical protein
MEYSIHTANQSTDTGYADAGQRVWHLEKFSVVLARQDPLKDLVVSHYSVRMAFGLPSSEKDMRILHCGIRWCYVV